MKSRTQYIPHIVDAVLLTGVTAFLMVYFDVRYLFLDTVVTGGDTASWYGVARHLEQVLIPNGRLFGWDMGNFCGYPNFSFYFLPPFLLAVLPSIWFNIPLTITLKWVIMVGIFLFPLAVYFGLRAMDYRFPAPLLGASGSLIILFSESFTMFGGNTLSTFAGEFCYMFALALFVFFIGSFYHGARTGTWMLANGILLGLIGLSHLFVFIPALILLAYAFLNGKRVRYLAGVGFTAFACMAFWILPLVAYRHPYTTPVYMIWQEFVNLRYTLAGILILILFTGPRFALALTGQGEKPKMVWQWAFVAFSAAGTFAATYLAGEYLILGKNLWFTGLKVPDLSVSFFGKEIARQMDFWVMPVAVAAGTGVGGLGLRAYRLGSASFAGFCRSVGSISFLGLTLFAFWGLHTAIARAVPEAGLRAFLLNHWIMGVLYGAVILTLGSTLLFSRRFGTFLSRIASEGLSDRFLLWLTLVFGCVAVYFSAHFLQVPDIRFLPPLAYSLVLILCAETLGTLLSQAGMAVKVASAVTAGYLAILTVVFTTAKSDVWFRFNNRGYESVSGYEEFARINHYLKTSYSGPAQNRRLDPLNAPRVAYEKCDLYGPYGGDRAFESLPVFSGRQTLEGIHYAGSIASRFIAYLQTEFSRDVKTPRPLILSKIDPEALPAHFDLYNISQVVVRTDKAKKALNASPWFEKEAVFGDIAVFRYKRSKDRYVDVPKVRPVLYTGKHWVDDFFAWYKKPDQLDVLLAPDQWVKDTEDRDAFFGKIDAISDLESFQSKTLDRAGLEINTRLDHLSVRFTTNRPGLPHLIKVSYFPNWAVKGAKGVYPVSPHLMLVIPREKEVLLTYERSFWEILGLWITGGWLVFLLGKGAVRVLSLAIKQKTKKDRAKTANMADRFWGALEIGMIRLRPWAVVLVLTGALVLIATGAVFRNIPVRTYESGYRFYRQGAFLSDEGKIFEAQPRFEKAIRTLAPLLKDRQRYDHRDVINSLLLTAMCFENLGEYDKAENWYRTLITEYPHSRYVGEAYVKTARIYKRRIEPVWRDGLNKLHQGTDPSDEQLLKDGLALMEKSLQYYHQAIQKDPYSVWADYAREDLEGEKNFFEKAEADLLFLHQDSQARHLLASLKIRLEEIRKK